MSNIPTILPIIGNIAAAGADFIVLTKNQVMMLYKLAAVFGRDLRDQRGILQDVLPVVGAGLIWRTVAREAADIVAIRGGDDPQAGNRLRRNDGGGTGGGILLSDRTQADSIPDGSVARQAAELLRQLDLPGVRRVSEERMAPSRMAPRARRSRPLLDESSNAGSRPAIRE